ncbi:MAG TPA: CdaR family protein [Polyangiaceae bacterium]|nr:CdaR family protein [Polyangiaceae bacterium]
MNVDVAYRARAFVTENFKLKLLSLVFALILYSAVHGSQDAQRSLLLGVVALTPPESANRELVTNIPAQIRVTVRGPRSALDEVHADDLSVQVDLRGGNETRLTFDPSMIPVPPGLKIEQIDPPDIDLAWEDRIVRDIPVEVGIVGTPAPGFVVKGAPAAEPPTVRARGPKSEVMVLQHARSDAFDVTGLTAGAYTRQLAIDRPSGRVSYDVPSIAGKVEIGREVVERPFMRVAVAVLGRPNAKSQPAEVDVRLACPPEIVRALRTEQIVPRVQVTSAAEHGSDALPVQLTVDQCEIHTTPPSVVVRW